MANEVFPFNSGCGLVGLVKKNSAEAPDLPANPHLYLLAD